MCVIKGRPKAGTSLFGRTKNVFASPYKKRLLRPRTIQKKQKTKIQSVFSPLIVVPKGALVFRRAAHRRTVEHAVDNVPDPRGPLEGLVALPARVLPPWRQVGHQNTGPPRGWCIARTFLSNRMCVAPRYGFRGRRAAVAGEPLVEPGEGNGCSVGGDDNLVKGDRFRLLVR